MTRLDFLIQWYDICCLTRHRHSHGTSDVRFAWKHHLSTAVTRGEDGLAAWSNGSHRWDYLFWIHCHTEYTYILSMCLKCVYYIYMYIYVIIIMIIMIIMILIIITIIIISSSFLNNKCMCTFIDPLRFRSPLLLFGNPIPMYYSNYFPYWMAMKWELGRNSYKHSNHIPIRWLRMKMYEDVRMVKSTIFEFLRVL